MSSTIEILSARGSIAVLQQDVVQYPRLSAAGVLELRFPVNELIKQKIRDAIMAQEALQPVYEE